MVNVYDGGVKVKMIYYFGLTGRVHGGKYDGWFGKVSSNLQYNTSQVRSSLAGQAVQTTPFSVPDDTVILRLRNEATVHCTKTRGKYHSIEYFTY